MNHDHDHRERGPKNTGRLRACAGWTLVELIAVLTLVGLLSVSAIATFSKDDSESAVQAVNLRQHIRYAQSMAMKYGDIWGISMSASSYFVFSGSTANKVEVPGADTVDVSVVSISNPLTIYFDEYGRPFQDAGLASPYTDTSFSLDGHQITLIEETGYLQ